MSVCSTDDIGLTAPISLTGGKRLLSLQLSFYKTATMSTIFFKN
ncbi:hypothetical protein SAMN04487964_10970 [Marinobacterium sediminicola]|uniref:Uncharacterized protein n=1 Tax=Marinobacterium sediminicola TaxID=518898 RepID=A0ABY1S151_9GAMM|nr:hypothetical protein SAMN04487964_10970 [Marinobacterium sediminicola]